MIWTRHRRPPDLTRQVRAWFAESGFEEIAFDALETSVFISVGVPGSAAPRQPGCLAAGCSPSALGDRAMGIVAGRNQVLVIGCGGVLLRKWRPGGQPGSGSIVSMWMKPLRSQKARVDS